MEYLLNSREMKACDSGTIGYFGVPSLVLMERAALAASEEIMRRIPAPAKCLAVCGSGNNGGDGLAIARLLFLKGYKVQIVFAGNREKMSEETAVQLAIAEKYQIPVTDKMPGEDEPDIIVDSIFGIGLSRAVEGRWGEILDRMNRMKGYKVAVDIASGISADTGQILGRAFRADLTVTFGFAKIGHILYPGAEYTGELAVRDIGIDEHGFLGNMPRVRGITKEDLAKIPARPENGNKGTFGKILIIGGSRNMAGAGVFSATAAYRSGGGLVRILTHESNRLIMQTLIPEAVLTTYEEKPGEEDEKILDCLFWADVIVLGPGIGTGEFAQHLTKLVLFNAAAPCILDADALNIIGKHMDWLTEMKAEKIITPHMGEMARLTGRSIRELKEDPVKEASAFAEKYHAITVLKDARTVTALPGGDVFINRSGNSGMATGGSGDVLTGVLAGLAGQGCELSLAAPLGVYLHGLAGDEAARERGKRGMTASDIAQAVGIILKEGFTENETI